MVWCLCRACQHDVALDMAWCTRCLLPAVRCGQLPWRPGAWFERWPASQPNVGLGFDVHPMLGAQEVVTAVKLKLHMTVLVLNDNAYGVRARGAALRGRLACGAQAALPASDWPPGAPLAMLVCCLVGRRAARQSVGPPCLGVHQARTRQAHNSLGDCTASS